MMDRIGFIRERDGPEEAEQYAIRSLAAYVMAAARKGRYHEQIEELEEYLRKQGYKINFVTTENNNV